MISTADTTNTAIITSRIMNRIIAFWPPFIIEMEKYAKEKERALVRTPSCRVTLEFWP